MCRLFRTIPLLLLATTLAVGGCKSSSTTNPATLAPGYLNTADQVMGQTIQAARSFYTSIQSQIAAATYTPSATEKTALDAFGVTLNQAQLEYLAYHNGAQTEAQASSAVATLQNAQTQLTSQLPTAIVSK